MRSPTRSSPRTVSPLHPTSFSAPSGLPTPPSALSATASSRIPSLMAVSLLCTVPLPIWRPASRSSALSSTSGKPRPTANTISRTPPRPITTSAASSDQMRRENSTGTATTPLLTPCPPTAPPVSSSTSWTVRPCVPPTSTS